MPPKSASKKDQKGGKAPAKEVAKTDITMSSVIRRNYLPRTYSGDNLLRSDRFSPVQKQLFKIPILLAWDNPRQVATLPELSRLDFGVEMKLMDIILGEDPLLEGTTTQEHNERIAKMAQRNLQEALSLAGRKRALLQERWVDSADARHHTIVAAMHESITNVNRAIDGRIQASLDSFLSKWQKRTNQIREYLQLLSNEHVAELRLDDLKSTKKKIKSHLESSIAWILEIENELETIESERAAKILEEFTSASFSLKRLNLERHDSIDKFLQTETAPVNVALVENRQTIAKYIGSLTMVLSELKAVSEKYISAADANWSRLRYLHIFPSYQAEVTAILDVDFQSFYQACQQTFDVFVNATSSEIGNVLNWNPADGLKVMLPKWKSQAESIAQGQDAAITSFTIDLENRERDMDLATQTKYQYWQTLCKEAKKDCMADMKGVIEKARKTQEINSGKQASMSLYSKAARNNFLLQKVTEFVMCISFTTSIFHQVQLLEVEAEVAKQQREIYHELAPEIKVLEKELFNELAAIRVENKEKSIYDRAAKARGIVAAIHKKHVERHTRCVEHIHSFVEKARAAHGVYKERLAKIFCDDRVVPEKEQMSERDLNLHELRFYPLKIEEWRIEQLQLVAQMKAKRTLPDLDEVLKLNMAKSSVVRKSTMKKIVPQVEKAVEQEKDEPRLLDGTRLYSFRDPVKTMEKLAAISEPYMGHFLDYTEESTEVVEIHTIQAAKAAEERKELCNRVMLDTEVIWTEVLKDINKKIQSKLEIMNRENIRRFADFEAIRFELDSLTNARIEFLPHIQLAHENEARFLIDTIHSIRDTYSSKIEAVFLQIEEFSDGALRNTMARLGKCASVMELKQLRERFLLTVERFQFNVGDEFERAGLDFDHSRKLLEKSKQPGNHSSAWLIIKEAGSYDPASIGTLLENWKGSILEDVVRTQKEVTMQIKSAQKEFDHHIADLELVEATQYRLKHLKTLLRGERISSNLKLEKLVQAIQKCREFQKTGITWVQCLDQISQFLQIAGDALEIAEYLSSTSNGHVLQMTMFTPSKDSWNQWKLHFHSNQLSIDDISISAHQFPALSRPGTHHMSRATTGEHDSLEVGEIQRLDTTPGLKPASSDPKLKSPPSERLSTATKQAAKEKTPRSSRESRIDSLTPIQPNTSSTTPKSHTPKFKPPSSSNTRLLSQNTNVSRDVSTKSTVLPPLPSKSETDLVQIEQRHHEDAPAPLPSDLDSRLSHWSAKARAAILDHHEVCLQNGSQEEILPELSRSRD
ncbi:hypothetical protein HDU91_003739 [Kappamyces sp. JEL0680]|nr:hypothetical protein HDU91_003739 [Kappamyces sp. JEL0680]